LSAICPGRRSAGSRIFTPAEGHARPRPIIPASGVSRPRRGLSGFCASISGHLVLLPCRQLARPTGYRPACTAYVR